MADTMPRKPRPDTERKPRAPAPAPASALREPHADEADDDSTADLGERIASRPDGHHWLSLDGRREFGPFDSFEEALADMQADAEETAMEPGETLQEAELELGISDWIDPDSGEPAEGLSTPRLHDE